MERSIHVDLPPVENVQDNLKANPYSYLKKLDFTIALQRFLTKVFYKLGFLIAKHPRYFIVIPIVICSVGIFGALRIHYISDIEFLYSTPDTPAKGERALIEHFFPFNSSNHFLPHFMTRDRGYGRILIEGKDKGSMFRKFLWKEIIELNEHITNFIINYKGKDYSYQDLCASWNNECSPNKVLDLYKYIENIENGSLKLNYPMMISPLVVPMFFGGLIIDKNKIFIESATSVSLAYFLKIDTMEDRERSELWEAKFISTISNKYNSFLHVTCSTSHSLQEAFATLPESVLPFIPIVGITMVLFSVSNTMMGDWVRSKFYLGFIGLLSATLALIGSIGCLMLIGLTICPMNLISPFIIIGISLDDMFVTLASWRRTNIQESVEERLAKTYADVGLSVLVTSLTNMISFLIGINVQFPSVKMFCIYSAMSIFILYLVHMTFFGGCLAVFGYFEKEQRHAVCLLRKCKPKSDVESTRSKWYSIWCAGGINEKDPFNEMDSKPHMGMVFFRDYFGKLLTKNYTKYCVLTLFVFYLSGGIYGFFHLTEGFDRPKTVRYDSHLYEFLSMEDSLYRHHAYNIQVMITGNISYSNSTTRKMIMDLHKELESLPFMASSALTISWMRNWFYKIKRHPILAKITDEAEFIKGLRETYLREDSNIRFYDVIYNKNYSRIVASRFFIQTTEIKDPGSDLMMLKTLRKIANQSPLNVTLCNPNFLLFDQGLLVKSLAIEATIIASISMMIISIILIPNKWCSIYIGLTLISVQVGVIGFMSLWSVSLNMVSMMCLIMCIGFCVDFTAHVSYSFCSSKCDSPDEKIMDSLYCLGLPLLQGGLSTVLGIFVFIFIPSYAYIYFFKVVALVSLFSLLHSLIFLPVLLSVAGPKSILKWCRNIQELCQRRKT